MQYLNINALPQDHTIEAVIQDPANTDATHFVVSNKQDLIMLRKFPPLPIYGREDEPGFALAQTEFHLGALPWIIDVIENRSWTPAGKGGLPNNIWYVKELVAKEDLLLRFTPNCGDEGEKGFTLENYHRPSVDGCDHYQSIQPSNKLLRESGLLDVCKRLMRRAFNG